MRARHIALIGALLIVVAAGLATVGILQYVRGATGDPASPGTLVAPAEPPGGESVTLRFFKAPAAVSEFTIRTLAGKTITSTDLVGKVTLINFWATWCGPCKAEIPDLVTLQDKYRDHLMIIGISEDEAPPDAVQRFANEHKVNYPVAMATDDIRRVFPGVGALPTTFVLDRDGRLVQKHVGLLDRTRTEHETRSLAGLPTRARVELVDPDKPVGLANAAQAKEIPGVDLTSLSPARRGEALQRLNTEGCTCGCGLTVAKCRIDDPACGVSLPVARHIVKEMASEPQAQR
jgi:thiol-disulfide isomerase/thioredoxin